jgi:hypothetical protein
MYARCRIDFEGVDRDYMPAGINGPVFTLEPMDDE